jgi:hypothetical protein
MGLIVVILMNDEDDSLFLLDFVSIFYGDVKKCLVIVILIRGLDRMGLNIF